MLNITIDGRALEAREGQTVLEVALPVVLLFWRERANDRRKNGMYDACGKAYTWTDTDSHAFSNHNAWTGTGI